MKQIKIIKKGGDDIDLFLQQILKNRQQTGMNINVIPEWFDRKYIDGSLHFYVFITDNYYQDQFKIPYQSLYKIILLHNQTLILQKKGKIVSGNLWLNVKDVLDLFKTEFTKWQQKGQESKQVKLLGKFYLNNMLQLSNRPTSHRGHSNIKLKKYNSHKNKLSRSPFKGFIKRN